MTKEQEEALDELTRLGQEMGDYDVKDADCCEWVDDNPDDIDGCDISLSTACGHAFVFNEGGVQDNFFNFCPYCGKQIKVVE